MNTKTHTHYLLTLSTTGEKNSPLLSHRRLLVSFSHSHSRLLHLDTQESTTPGAYQQNTSQESHSLPLCHRTLVPRLLGGAEAEGSERRSWGRHHACHHGTPKTA